MSLIAKAYKEALPKATPVTVAFGKVETFTDEVILYDDISHTYKTLDNQIMLSGSAYAHNFTRDFPREHMLKTLEAKWGVQAAILDDIWSMSGDISTSFGTSVHRGLELAHRYWEHGKIISGHKEIEANYCLPKHPVIRDIVLEFVEEFGTNALPEVFLSDSQRLMCGQVDRLELVDEEAKIARVQDYKTTLEKDSKGEVSPKLSKAKMTEYQHQMSFYAHILMGSGWQVPGIDLFVYDFINKRWIKTELEVLPLREEYLYDTNS